MTGKRASVLLAIAAASFILLALSAFIPTFAAKEETYQPSAEGYQSIEAESDGKAKKISGCLPQDEIAAYFEESLDGLISDISVIVDEDVLTAKGKLGNADKLAERFPQLNDALMIADIVAGAEATVKVKILYDEEKGFSTELTEAKIESLSMPVDIFANIAQDIEKNLNERIQGSVKIHSWKLREGGLYYSLTLEDEDDIRLIYPVV